ncbi:MAG: hypothetical protein JNK05_04855 [Myxococcales bacterium]|nr:hypothetical protein [Myxococcales bacterium]
MSTTAKEQLAARVAAMTEDEARAALEALDNPDGLTDDERRGILDAMAAMDRGEGIDGELVFRETQSIIDAAKQRRAAG